MLARELYMFVCKPYSPSLPFHSEDNIFPTAAGPDPRSVRLPNLASRIRFQLFKKLIKKPEIYYDRPMSLEGKKMKRGREKEEKF
jgi:hypothetical protein